MASPEDGPWTGGCRDRTRRHLLGSLGVIGLMTSGGCLGGSGSPTGRSTTGETSATNSGMAGDRTVTDDTGRTVTLPDSVDDVVAVGPGALNLVVYLDAVDLVVGVEENEHRWSTDVPYNLANPSLQEKPVIGPHKGGDPELIAGVDPDLVLTTYMTAGTATDLQGKLTRPVVVAKASGHDLHQFERFYEDLSFVGSLLGREDRAREVIAFVSDEVDRLHRMPAEAPDSKRRRVFIAGRSDTGGAGVTSTQHPFAPFDLVNAVNVAGSVSGHADVNEETLLTWDPATIFVSGSNRDRVLGALADPTYSGITAIERGAVYGLLPSRFYGDLYGNVLANAYYVGSVLYPDAFEDVDLVETADRIYDRLVGAPVYDRLAENFGGFERLEVG